MNFEKWKNISKKVLSKTKNSTIILTKNDLLNVLLSKRSDWKFSKFGNFWIFSKFQTSIANYKIHFKFFHLSKNQNLGYLWSFYVIIKSFELKKILFFKWVFPGCWIYSRMIGATHHPFILTTCSSAFLK